MEIISALTVYTEGNTYHSLNPKDQDGNWYNLTSNEMIKITPDIAGDRVDKTKLCPEYKGYKMASGLVEGKYVKTPISDHYALDDSYVVTMRNEIEAYEKLGSGHPNICKYHGCQVEDNLVTGIVLDEYSEPLEDAVVDSPQRLVEQLEDAVRYIHSVGVVHGDINPKNIMVHDGDLFLIDFDSCGADNPKSGSKGYMSPNYAKTEADDWYAVGKVKEFVMKSARSNDEPRGDRPQQGTAESAA